LELGQHHALEAGTAAPPGAGTGGRRGGVRGGRGSGLLDTCAHQIGGVAHEGSFPGADVGLLARRPVVRPAWSSLCGPRRGGGPPKVAEAISGMALPTAVAPSAGVTWPGRTDSGACPASRSVPAYEVLPTYVVRNTVRLGRLPEE